MRPREAFVVAGPNGAGKTTLALEIAADLGIPYVGADDIAARLDPADPVRARVAAGRQFFADIDRLAGEGASFVCETTLSGRGFAAVLTRLSTAWYTTTIPYVFVATAEVCLARVAERVRRGGHDVPEVDVRRRYLRSKSNFWNLYRPLADNWSIVHNGSDGFQVAASGTQDSESIRSDVLFNLFLQDIQPDAH